MSIWVCCSFGAGQSYAARLRSCGPFGLRRQSFSDIVKTVKNVTVKCPEDVQRRFAAWCKLNGRTIQEVLIEFMREKGEALARFEDRKSAR